MATSRTAAIGMLASGTSAPRSTAKPPNISTKIVSHPMRCGAGTLSACKIASALYEPIESVLAADIADGSLPPETQLPPEEGLIERFKVSRTTERKAIQNLIERGLVEVRR